MVKQAEKIASKLKDVQVVYQIYSDGIFVLDTEEDAKEACAGINGGEFSNGIKSKCYYKPCIIDMDSGEIITRKNIDLYRKNKYDNIY